MEGDSHDSLGNYNLVNSTMFYPSGKIGQAVYLSSTSLSCGLASGTEWTVSIWVKFDSFLNNNYEYNEIWGTGMSLNSSGLLVALYYDRSSTSIKFWNGGPSVAILSGAILFKWYHIVVTAGTAMFAFYVDGLFIATQNTTGDLTFTGFTLGGYLGEASPGEYPMDGLVDEVGIWSSVLNTSTIASLYNTGLGRRPAEVGGSEGSASSSTASPITPTLDPGVSNWQDWATTSKFIGLLNPPTACWPGWPPASSILLANLNGRNGLNTMGAAVPWNVICKYGSRLNWMNAIIGSATGLTNGSKPCFAIQPIQKYPDEVTGLFCSGSSCSDINKDNLAATANGTTLPEYLIIPYEGCGGDWNPTSSNTPSSECVDKDCINDCSTGNIAGLLSSCTIPYDDGSCGVAYTMAANHWNASVYVPLIKGYGPNKIGYPVGISNETNYGRNVVNSAESPSCQRVNYCTGQNLHFDIALNDPDTQNPLWVALNSLNVAKMADAPWNIIVRYKQVECNYFGNFDPSDGCEENEFNKQTLF